MTTNKLIKKGNCTFWDGLRDIIAIIVKQSTRIVIISIGYHYPAKQWYLSSLSAQENNKELFNYIIAPIIWLPGGKHGQPDDPINGYIDLYEKIANTVFDSIDIIVLTKNSTDQVPYSIINQII